MEGNLNKFPPPTKYHPPQKIQCSGRKPCSFHSVIQLDTCGIYSGFFPDSETRVVSACCCKIVFQFIRMDSEDGSIVLTGVGRTARLLPSPSSKKSHTQTDTDRIDDQRSGYVFREQLCSPNH